MDQIVILDLKIYHMHYKTSIFAYPDEFIKHGSIPDIEKKYGLDVDSIYKSIKKDK